MMRTKLMLGLVAALFVSGVAMLDGAVAGDKVKAHATNITTKFEKIDVGDVDGHVVVVYQAKQIWVEDDTGEKSTGVSSGVMDMNFKTGEGSITGYSVRSYPNGEKLFSRTEGKPVGKGQTKGTFIYMGGTGKYEGLKGRGTWASKTMAPGVSYTEAEGEREY